SAPVPRGPFTENCRPRMALPLYSRASCHHSAKAFAILCDLQTKGERGSMSLARRVASAGTASLPIAAAFFLLNIGGALAEGPAATCDDAAELAVLAAPLSPWKGAPLRVVFAAEKPLEGEFSLIAPNGSVAARSAERHGGPPYFWYAEVAAPAVGTW